MIAQTMALMPSPVSSSARMRTAVGHDRDGHAAGRHQVAVACRGRGVHPRQADDERDGADKPGDADEDLDDLQGRHDQASGSAAGVGATVFLRNIWSIRSVTT